MGNILRRKNCIEYTFFFNDFCSLFQYGGIEAAAITTVIAEMVIMVGLLTVAYQYVHLFNNMRNVITSVAGRLVIFLFCMFIKDLEIEFIKETVLCVMVSMLLYFVTLIVLKNEIALGILKRTKEYMELNLGGKLH